MIRVFSIITLVILFCFSAHYSLANLPLNCKMATDQLASLNAPLKTLPLRVVLDSGFGATQKKKIMQAIDEWNSFSKKELGKTFFVFDKAATSNYQKFLLGNKYCRAKVGGKPEGLLIIGENSVAHWRATAGELEKGSAFNLRCSLGDGVKQSQQIIEIRLPSINYDQFQSVVLHELGHAIGLHHSCRSGEGFIHYRDCSGLNFQHPYFMAVMYPVLLSTSIAYNDRSIKESLQRNDIERAYCLYGDR